VNLPKVTIQNVEIGKIFKVSSGGTPSRKKEEYFKGGDIAWVKTGDLKGKFANKPSESITKLGLENSSAKLFPPKTVLLAMYGATIGACSILPFEAATNQACAAILPSDDCYETYLYYYLTSIKDLLINQGVGGAQPNISSGLIKKLKIPLPPLPEQKKIAEILDAADNLRQKDQQLIDHYNTLSQSLFLDMFGDPVGNKKNWKVKKLSEVCSTQLGKMLSQASKQNINPKKYLRNANVRWGYFQLKDILEMDFHEKDIKKFALDYGDLLVCEGGDIGRCAIWKDNLKDCYYQKALHRVRVNKSVLTPEYMQSYFYWMSKLGGLRSSTSEVTFSHLTAEKLKKLEVPTPPINLQNKYSEHLLVLDKQKQQAQASLKKSEELFNSLLQKAFKGELTHG